MALVHTEPMTTMRESLPTLLRKLLGALALLLMLAPTVQAQLLPTFGRDRAGTSGFQFLKIPVDARSAAMGQTASSHAFDASALFWNPALAARADGIQIGLSQTAYFADVSLSYAAVAAPVGPFVLGASLQVLNSGDIQETTEFEPLGTGRTFSATDLALGLSLSQSLSDLFSYGVTLKYVEENIAEVTVRNVMVDLGVFYQIGATGAQMAVAIRNFGPDTAPTGTLERTAVNDAGLAVEDDFETITPPTTFLLGLSYRLLRDDARQDLLVSGQLNNPNDNAESYNLGAEYTWNELLILRTGYRFGVVELDAPSFGVGLQVPDFGPELRVDYGFNRLNRLGNVHRIGLNVQL
ncbi:MAG: PorV/PorQ family protein [Bacteroidota bacterium]